LWEENITGTPEVIREKIISMACKSAVKGNQSMTKEGMEALLEQLFTLDNPYHCPHGRPTIISMTKNQLEKKFKRIV
ncbi:MAG: DNA mismatch repair protein MutL, partial [Lachnospiraceae bacterium]|nr:DNA mismatch repair protein MutL [Lachnospiraceae bacterium]